MIIDKGNTKIFVSNIRKKMALTVGILTLSLVSLTACSSGNEKTSSTETVETVETESKTEEQSIRIDFKKKGDITVKTKDTVLLHDIIESIKAQNGIKTVDIQIKDKKDADTWSLTDVKDGKEVSGVPAKEFKFEKEGTYTFVVTVTDEKGETEDWSIVFVVKDDVPETEESESEKETSKNNKTTDKTTTTNKDVASSGLNDGNKPSISTKPSTGNSGNSGSSNSGSSSITKPSAGNNNSSGGNSGSSNSGNSTTTKPSTGGSSNSGSNSGSMTKPETKLETKTETKPETKPSIPEPEPETETKPVHQHTWLEVTHQENHPYDDIVGWKYVCNGCKADITSDPWGHLNENALAGNMACTGYSQKPVYGQVDNWITVSDGYKCACGATK